MPDDKITANDKVSVEFHWEKSDIPTIHVNQLLITHAGPEFYLIFGEVIPIDEDNPSQLPKTLSVKQRVRVAVPREMMGVFAETINNNYGKFVTKIKEAMAQATKEESNDVHSNDVS